MRAPRVVIVGHVEWVTHALGTLPGRGHIADLQEAFGEPAGGGGVAAAAAARLGADAVLLTAFGDDDCAQQASQILSERGVTLAAASRAVPQTPVLTVTEPDGERTIMVVGPRLQASAEDGLHPTALYGADAAYYTGEDPALLEAVRAAVPILVVSARRLADVVASGVRPDVVVGSANDPAERTDDLPASIAPMWVVRTDGARGGVISAPTGAVVAYDPAVPPASVRDTYGCGDSFAAGLTVGLALGLDVAEAASFGATAGAACATWRGGIGPE